LDTIAELNASASLLGRYAIERELGRGGMAIVYLAQDTRHGRRVAIKVLRRELSAAVGAERFVREINLTASLTHPRIVAIYDSGAVDEMLYYVMPFVAGESLRDRLRRDGQLPLDVAVQIALNIASALSYAHDHGVAHRDIKPENILLADGEVTVADFGISRAVEATGEDRLTQTGVSLGTPAYMSPEQSAGEPNLDGRTDIFALGCVLYEMLVGEPPFRGPTVQATAARVALQPMPSIREVRPAVPVAIESVVRKAVEKVPADRFATAGAFADALRAAAAEPATTVVATRDGSRRKWWMAAATVLLVVIGGGVAMAAYSALHGDAVPSIAVLAFRSVAGDSTNEAFSDGMSEEITTALQKTRGLTVAPRASAFFFKGKSISEQEIGRQLRVRYVVDGQVRTGGRRRRTEVQLIDVRNGGARWTGNYESELDSKDPFAVQDSIAGAIVKELRVHFSAVAAPAPRSTESSEAHDLYLYGRYFFEKRNLPSVAKAKTYFEQAIQRDSSYALAYAGLSGTYGLLSLAPGARHHEYCEAAKSAARSALARDSLLAEARTALAFALLMCDWNAVEAGREFDRSLALDPNYAPTHLFRGLYFVALGDVDHAVREGREAVRLEPLSLVNNVRLATWLFHAHDYRATVDEGRRIAELDSTWGQWQAEVRRAYVLLGRCDSAVAIVDSVTATPSGTGWVLARCGGQAAALTELDKMRREVAAGNAFHTQLATIYAGLGDKNSALAQLDSAVANHEWWLIMLKTEPEFEGLHSDPRFARLVERVGIAR
jgi:serine/threonine-protein kinase